MSRRQLADGEGMLLVYPATGMHYIWMKNVLVPLSVVWLDAEARVIDKRLLEPCLADPCTVYGINHESRLVLELSAAAFDRVQPGDRFPEMLEYLSRAE